MPRTLVKPKKLNLSDEELRTIGERIRILREERGWTEGQLARRCRMTPSTVRRIEAGDIRDASEINRIAIVFNVAAANLLDPDLKCNRCGDCCRQFSIRLPVKKSANVRGMLLFYNLHENVHAKVVEDASGQREIVIQIRNKCSMLVEHPDGTTSCKLYWMRPPICRIFPEPDGLRGPDLPTCSMVRDGYGPDKILDPDPRPEGR